MDPVAQHLADLGAISLEDFLADAYTAPQHTPLPAQCLESADVNAVTQLHQACQRTLRSTDALKFEFIEHAGARHKQCILTITRPDGVRRSYTTQPVFAKKSEAKLEAAKLAIDMGALDFLAGETRPVCAESDTADTLDTFVEDIEKCCLEWRASHVTPRWVPFSDPKSMYKHGCALRIQLSPHVVRVYLADPTFDAYPDAKGACAKVAVLEGVLDFIKHGNGQMHPPSPPLTTPSTNSNPPVTVTTPLTVQAFYDSLPRPFPESFGTNDASEINAPAWLNTMVQNARGGKLILSFFFTSDGSPGLHGCLLKLDRPGEYKASLVDARFPKRADAKAAVCLQAMSEGIGNYIRAIMSNVETRITPAMRSFSSSLVFPALTSELSKVGTGLHPSFEYEKERDAFGATMVVRLAATPTAAQVRHYAIPSNYRNKADAKVGVICRAAEQGVVEFVRFRGETLPDGYVSPYTLYTYNPNAPRKRKKPASAEDMEQGPPTKKKKKGKRRAEVSSQSQGSLLVPPVYPSRDQIHGMSGPSDMGPLQSVPADDSCDPSQPGFRDAGGSGAARPAVFGHGTLYDARTYPSAYPASLDPRFASGGGTDRHAGGAYPVRGTYGGGPRAVDDESGPSRPRPDTPPPVPHRPVEPTELEPGEVVSSAESEFSESSSRNEDVEAPTNQRGTDATRNGMAREANVEQNEVEGKSKAEIPTNTATTASQDDPSVGTAIADMTSHVKRLIDYCAQHLCDTPSFHETKTQGRFQVWIVIGKERFELPKTYASAEEGRQRVAKQVLVRLSKG